MARQTTGREKRAFPRLPAHLPVEVVRPESVSVLPINAELIDISQNGALLKCNEKIPVGEWIIIRPAFGQTGEESEITAVVERMIGQGAAEPKLACRFPVPVDYWLVQRFL